MNDQPKELILDFSLILKILRKSKWLIIVAGILFGVASVFYALQLPNIYRSSVMLIPASLSNSGGISGLNGQLGSLASFAGIQLGDEQDNSELALEIMQSRKFVLNFVKKHNLEVDLFASIGWNPNTNELIIDSEVYDLSSKAWTREVKPPKKPEPSEDELVEAFLSRLNILNERDRGIIYLQIDFFSPHFAKQVLELLVQEINLTLKSRDTAESIKSISFLESELAKTSVAEHRTVLFRLIEEQTKSLMLANIRDDYVFVVIDPAFVPEKKAAPRRVLVVIVLTVILSAFFVFALVLIGIYRDSDVK